MADNYVTVNSAVGGDTKMQTYLNTISGSSVHAEAVALVDSSGQPITTLPVSIAGNVNVNTSTREVTSSNASNFLVEIQGPVDTMQSGIWNLSAIFSNVNVADAGGSLTVDGTIAATQSGTWNIGTIATLPTNSTFDQTRVLGTTIDVNSGNKSAGTQRVILATDQPNVPVNVLGTVTTSGTITANSSFNLNQVLGTTVDVNSGNKSAGTQRVVLATDQPALTNKLLVTPDANSSFNLSQILGTTVDSNSGNKSAGTQRVVLATDQPALTNKLLVTPDANSSFNLSQILGTTVDGNSGNKSAGTLRVVLATDQPALTNKLLVTPDANINIGIGQVAGAQTATASTGIIKVGIVGSTGTAYTESVSGVQDVMPRLRDGSTGLSPQWFISRISTQLNSFPTNSTCYIECIKVMPGSVTTAALTVRDQSGSGNRTLFAIANIAQMNLNGILENYQGTLKCTGGLNINTTGGASPSDVNVWIKYWQ